MKLEIRDTSSSAETLMRDVLRDGGPIAPEYPLVFSADFPGRIVTLAADGETPLSTCAILTRELLVPGGRFRVGLVGSVATDPEHRGQGYGTEVLATSEQEFTRAGCVCALLWADAAEYYEERGYVPVGAEDIFVLAPDVAPRLGDATGVRDVRSSDGPAIHELYRSHISRVERTRAEAAALLATPNMTTLVRERHGGVVAYACLGRGADFGNVVHEWAGEPEDVLALVRGHLERYRGSEQLAIMIPPADDRVHEALLSLGVEGARGVLGMAKLTSPPAAAELLRLHVGEAGRVEPRDDGLLVAGPAGRVQLSAEETLLVLFPPQAHRGVIEALENETGLTLEGLPLTPFLWGLDSI